MLKKTSVHFVDVRSSRAVDTLVRRVMPKTIFHLATHGAYPAQQYDEEEILATNVHATFNLMRSCLRIGFDAFVNTGSSSEYGSKQAPMKEGDVLAPTTAYGASKAWATLYGQYLARTHGAPIVTLRLFSVYGPYEPYEPLGRLVPNLAISFLTGKPFTLTSPRTARDFVFVGDVVDAFLRAARHPASGTVFNIGSGKQTTLKEMFLIARDVAGAKKSFIEDNASARSFDTHRWVADIRLAKEQLGWEPATDLREGLRKTFQWFKKNMRLYKIRS